MAARSARRRRTDPRAGRAALVSWLADDDGADLATAVRFSLEELAEQAPGAAVEVRVPPYAAVQVIEGPRHTRGTPPGVVETDAVTWLALATGRVAWPTALAHGTVAASGDRADLSAVLPLKIRGIGSPL